MWEVLHGARANTLGGLTNSTKNHLRYQGKVSVLRNNTGPTRCKVQGLATLSDWRKVFQRWEKEPAAYAVQSVTKLTIVKMAHFVPVFHKFSGNCCHHQLSFKLSLNVAPKVQLSSQTSDCRPNSLTTVDCREQPSTFVCKYSTVVHKCSMIVQKHSTVIRERSTVVRWSCAFGQPLAAQIMGHTGNEFNC